MVNYIHKMEVLKIESVKFKIQIKLEIHTSSLRLDENSI